MCTVTEAQAGFYQIFLHVFFVVGQFDHVSEDSKLFYVDCGGHVERLALWMCWLVS